MKRSMPLSLPTRIGVCAAAVLAAVLMLASLTFAPRFAVAATGDLVRGTVTSDLALYEAADASTEAVDYLSAGTTLQALDLGDGWYGARFSGAVRYFCDMDRFAFYTASDTTVYRGAVMAGGLDVLLTPLPGGAACAVFAEGATIQFCAFNDSYYMARLGDGMICYIDAARVRLYVPEESGTLVRWAGEGGARVFAAPDASSTLLSQFEAGAKLWFADFDGEWLMASMIFNDSVRTVFVPKADVLAEEPAPEPAPEPEPVATTWVIATVSASGMSAPSWESDELEQFRKGAVFTGAPTDNGWYLVVYDGTTMYLSPDEVRAIPASSYTIDERAYGTSLSDAVATQDDGTWIFGSDTSSATSSQWLRTYMDPDNFAEGTSGFFQFLVLTQPLGVSVDTLNAQLAGKGALEGQGKAFHDAAYAYGVNEAYLISHALHETGNGSSHLAQGVWYNPQSKAASYEQTQGSVLVYNVYGIGAVDSNPLNGGARYAYEHKWFTVYDAVYGGAYFIALNYLYSDAASGSSGPSTLSGQNTLYKMLYHPEWVETYGTKPWHEYATDVAWAYSQTYFITQLLADYDNYSLVFEVPVYAGE